jgi:Ser/Thr protein kinase RdoA (MazF antagonist)
MSTETNTNNAIGAIGSKLTDMELAKEALSRFLDEETCKQVTMTSTSGGVNNIVQYVTLPSGERRLLRIYNNGFDTQRVKFEHTVLQKLQEMQGPEFFSFQVPNFLTAINYKEGGFGSELPTMVQLSNGSQACMCTLIPGQLPKLSCARDIGRACGELNTALARLTPHISPSLCNCAPYADMYKVHHAITPENFLETMQSSAFDHVRKTATRMTQETLDICERCQTKYKTSLPTQLIHGDLHYDNVLVDKEQEKVTGLLDFEFCSFDWRALEMAISLSKYAGEEPDAMPYFDDFIDGYSETGVLTLEEARAIPDLINLRILSNVVYFCGRAVAGEDDISSLTTRIANYEKRVNWIKEHGDQIVARIIDKMGLKE